MRILSLDTSFSFFNLSVVEEGRVKLIHYIDTKRKTLENIPKVLSELCLRPESFDAFAVSVGVGYLTSVRIGVTFMKTVAYTLKKPIVSYENLYLMGRFTPVPEPKIPYLKVSTNLFYRLFDKGKVSEVKIFSGEKLRGTGISILHVSDTGLGDREFFHPFFPFSAYGGIYAHEFLMDNPEGEDLFSIEPLYLKPPV
jgi:tRNA A37 threonylcarbamoyladenosine modification protein TsaB